MNEFVDEKRITTIKTIFLHLFPGIVNLSVMLLLLRLTEYLGSFSLAIPYFMVVISIVPLQMGYLFYIAKKTKGTYKITKIIPYQNNSKFVEYLIFIVIISSWAILVSRTFESFEIIIRDRIFAFVPNIIALRNIDLTLFSKNELLFTAIFGIFANGLLAPITEELYFRGYLLPRINLSLKWAVLLNASLFSLYHFFSPWLFFSRLFMMMPIYYWTVKRKNIRFALSAHLIANLYTNIRMLILILSKLS